MVADTRRHAANGDHKCRLDARPVLDAAVDFQVEAQDGGRAGGQEPEPDGEALANRINVVVIRAPARHGSLSRRQATKASDGAGAEHHGCDSRDG